MQRRQFTVRSAGAVIGWGLPLGLSLWTGTVQAQGLSSTDAASGIRVALERGAVAAVAALGRQGGFLDDPRVRIPLPGFLNDAANLLKAKAAPVIAARQALTAEVDCPQPAPAAPAKP